WRLNNIGFWNSLNSNLQITQFTGIALHPSNPDLAFGGSQDNGMERFNDALGWKRLLGGDGGFVRIDRSNPLTIYAEQQNVNLFRSDDGGGSFTRISPPV